MLVMSGDVLKKKVALVTGGARRVGAHIVRTLHAQGMYVAVHYHSSQAAAQALQYELQTSRPGSVLLLRGDLHEGAELFQEFVERTVKTFRRLDVLINNASAFYATPVESASGQQWDDLLGTNLKAPFFLAQAAARQLKATSGCIVNIADIYGERPLKRYPIYSIAKAGVFMLTKALARELAPEVRVNAVAPGPILWPEQGLDEAGKVRVIARTALKRMGDPDDVARAVLFLIRDAGYITGQVIAVDGGRRIVA
jgi:pteridine reductase